MRYNLAFSCDTGALVPAVGDLMNSLNECLEGFGVRERVAVRSRICAFSFEAERALTDDEKTGVSELFLKHLNEKMPGYHFSLDSFSVI